jgi:methionine sulfoxide reductase heme-binding subunit
MIQLAMTPSPLWYADRGTGAVTMALLTASVVLGMGTTVRWKSPVWPKYISVPLHQNVSILIICFLFVHILTALLDPFAKLGLKDALVPFSSWYRPLWLGMGVIAAELVAALALTSAVRGYIGFKVWRFIHWFSYAAWPAALLHGLGTGSDARMAWFLWANAACVFAAWLAVVFWRLSFGWPRLRWPRLAAAVFCSLGVVGLAVWMLNGPLTPGWARVAGTPLTLLQAAHPAPPPAPTPHASP